MNPTHPKSPFAIVNVRMFVVFRVFFNARFYYPVFTILFLDYGLTLSQFAVLNAVWAASIVLLEVPSGALADTIGRRNLLVFAGVLMVTEMALLAFVPVGNVQLVFWAFLFNRILSGAAEAAASGADEAIAYDALVVEGRAEDWGRVLEWQMRMKSLAYIAAMSMGAAIYDPDVMQRVAGWVGYDGSLSQTTTMRFPIYLTLAMACVALWSTFRMREPKPENGDECTESTPCNVSIVEAFRLTLRAGLWILKTPFALVVILSGMLFDHVIRMLITMTSQYYRLIDLPEASYGLIGSGLAVLGLFIPRMARYLAENHSPTVNLMIITGITFAGIAGMTPFFHVFGLIPVVILSSTMYFTGFFVSHYLNSITHSSQRATVLSFKGLSYNLAYGFIGLAYSLLLAYLRSDIVKRQTDLSPAGIEDLVFMGSISWFPWYYLVLMAVLLGYACYLLRGTSEHKRPVMPTPNSAA